jgi:hypothetical protein
LKFTSKWQVEREPNSPDWGAKIEKTPQDKIIARSRQSPTLRVVKMH